MNLTLSPPLAETDVVCPLAAYGILRADAGQLAALRRRPGSYAGAPLSPALLKNADDQTVAAVATVLKTIAQEGWDQRSFRDWGVLAAPNFFGRFGTMQALKRFLAEGAWGISPHMIPHHSLHAVSGTLSQALQIFGPNFGIGGGGRAVSEAFLVAATMVSENNLPGVWLVLTGFDPEYVPNDGANQSPPTTCMAAALALLSDSRAGAVDTLRVGSGPSDCDDAAWPEFRLASFLDCLEETSSAGGRWRLPGGGRLALDRGFDAEAPR